MLATRVRTTIAIAATAAGLTAGTAPASAACPTGGGYHSGGSAGASFPNDPLFERQWGLEQIKAPQAWARGGRGAGAVIAIVDSGVDMNHPDLEGKILPGIDFVPGGDDSCAGPQDENGHGTHVAGIAAALTNNGIGVAGVAPDAKILPVRVLDKDGSGTGEGIAKGIRWATDHGASVINLSIGTDIPFPTAEGDMADAAQEAFAKGVSVVVSAGNSTAPFCGDTSAGDNMICVGATDSFGFPSWYSNFPNSLSGVGVRAPGGQNNQISCDDDVWSTYWPGSEGDVCEYDGYEPLAGTSMAAPHVAGLAAILRAAGLTNVQVLDCLRATSSNGGSSDPVFGYGIVNADAASGQCAGLPRSQPGPAAPPASGGGGTTTGGGTTGGGTQQPGSGGVQGQHASGDTRAPHLRLALGSRRAHVAKAGYVLARVRVDEASTVSVRVMSGRIAAAAGRNALRIAAGRTTFRSAGSKTIRLRLTKAGRAVMRKRRTLTVTLIGRALDRAGNSGTAVSQGKVRR
jgi:subtilisin family serine protease